MPNPIFELFQNPGTMLAAEQDLIKLGEVAIPELMSLFSGASKNKFGVPYRNLGLPLRCALEVACRLGPVARPLECFLRDELERDPVAAMQALGSLGELQPDSVAILAAYLDGSIESIASGLPMEAAVALIRCGCSNDEFVLDVLRESAVARQNWDRSLSYLASYAR